MRMGHAIPGRQALYRKLGVVLSMTSHRLLILLILMVGLSIGAVSPAEIAVAVLAEITAALRLSPEARP